MSMHYRGGAEARLGGPGDDAPSQVAGPSIVDLRRTPVERRSRVDAVVLEAGPGQPVADLLDEEFDNVLRLGSGVTPGGLEDVLRRERPRLLLVKGSLDMLEFTTIAVCAITGTEPLVLARPAYGMLGPRRLRRYGSLPWLPLGATRVGGGGRFKRIAETALVVITLPITVVVMAVIAVVLLPGGNPLYLQHRVGMGGRTFRMMKFRTMVAGAEEGTGPVVATPDDPRITRLGHTLRRLRLDELPQLFNVLRGDMSLVGPRPERPEIMGEFQDLLPDYDLRHLIRPGLTGIAQLTGGYGAAVEDKLRCDLLYIGCRSNWLDITLLLRTVLDLARGFPRG